jgi:multiple sugar transport system substrate-binding protein
LATEQHTKYPTLPFGFSYHPAYVQMYTENVWGKAISRVVTEKWSNEQAVDGAVTRIETIFKNWR